MGWGWWGRTEVSWLPVWGFLNRKDPRRAGEGARWLVGNHVSCGDGPQPSSVTRQRRLSTLGDAGRLSPAHRSRAPGAGWPRRRVGRGCEGMRAWACVLRGHWCGRRAGGFGVGRPVPTRWKAA